MKNNQRIDARVDVDLPLQVNQICFEGDHKLKLNKTLPIKMVNLSASGVKIYSTLELPINLKLFVNLFIEGKIIHGYIDIIRKEKSDTGFSYGCRLYTSQFREKLAIRKFVHKTINTAVALKDVSQRKYKGTMFI